MLIVLAVVERGESPLQERMLEGGVAERVVMQGGKGDGRPLEEGLAREGQLGLPVRQSTVGMLDEGISQPCLRAARLGGLWLVKDCGLQPCHGQNQAKASSDDVSIDWLSLVVLQAAM